MALGATAVDVVRLALTQSARVAAIGGVIGAVITFSMMKLPCTVVRLRNVSLVDYGAFVIGLLLVTPAVAIAIYWPTHRATRVDPFDTLRPGSSSSSSSSLLSIRHALTLSDSATSLIIY